MIRPGFGAMISFYTYLSTLGGSNANYSSLYFMLKLCRCPGT